MRFIHTADWHLGRLMHGVHLTADQSYVLDQVTELVKDTRPDAFLISGDIYDRALPPPDAVQLLDDFLTRMVIDLGVPVMLIAGNHDSACRLEFGSRVLAGQNLYVSGSVAWEITTLTVGDDAGPVRFYALPYAEPAIVRERFMSESISDHEQALRALIERVRAIHPPGERSVLLAHAFVAGGKESESERPLSVGGSDKVDSSCFEGFNYVALGHLHRPQNAGGPQIRYAGSLLKYSFSEIDHKKTINLVEMDKKGECRIESIPLAPRRDVRRIEGYLNDILDGPESGESREDYVMVSLLDTGAILDVMGKLREVYPNVLHVERPRLELGSGSARDRVDHRKLNDADLFADFFSQVTGNNLTEAEAVAFDFIVDDLRRRAREAAVHEAS